MAGNFTFTSTGLSVLDFAYLQAGTVDNEFLNTGSSLTTADDFAAKILTRCERDILSKNPTLNRAEAVQTVAAGSRELVLPVAMDGMDLDLVQLVREDDPMNGYVIMEASPQDGQDRWGSLVDNFQSPYPTFYYWNEDRSAVLLQYMLSVNTDFRLTFRQGARAYTAAGLGTEISRIPDEHIDALYLKVADQFLRIMGKIEAASVVSMQAEEANQELTDSLIGPYWKHRAYRSQGYPESSMDFVTQSANRGRDDSYSTMRY